MWRVKWVPSLAAASLAACVAASTASAATPLILKEGSAVAPEGSRAAGSLNMTCADLGFGGTLTINGEPVDEAVWDEGGGTDVCEGVFIGGIVKAVKVTATGRFIVLAHLTYESVSARKCVWVIRRLSGTFPIPGLTKSTVRGTGKLLAKRSATGCAEQIAVEGKAVLSSGATNEPYFAET